MSEKSQAPDPIVAVHHKLKIALHRAFSGLHWHGEADKHANDFISAIDALVIARNNMIEKVHDGVATNVCPQGPSFPWRDGWTFARGQANDVHVWKTSSNGFVEVSLCIAANEWASIVRCLSIAHD